MVKQLICRRVWVWVGDGGFQQKKRKKQGPIMDEIEEIQNLCNMKPLRDLVQTDVLSSACVRSSHPSDCAYIYCLHFSPGMNSNLVLESGP